MTISYLLNLCRLIVLYTFLLSFIGKARNVSIFRQTIAEFEIIPQRWVAIFAAGLLVNELLIVVCTLISGCVLIIGFLLASFWLVIFSIALSKALCQGSKIDCNCFGPGQNRISVYDLVRDLFLLLVCISGIIILQQPVKQMLALQWADWIIVGLVSAIILVIILNLYEIALLFRQQSEIR